LHDLPGGTADVKILIRRCVRCMIDPIKVVSLEIDE
jgi:hypothetical protein